MLALASVALPLALVLLAGHWSQAGMGWLVWLWCACAGWLWLAGWLAGWLAEKYRLTCYWHVSDMLQSRIAGFAPALRWLARVCVRAKLFWRVNPFGKVVFGKVV
jgi:hypothetical protein